MLTHWIEDGCYSDHTSREPEAGHDGSDPADALGRASKLVLQSHKEDPEALQRAHDQHVYLRTQQQKSLNSVQTKKKSYFI